MDALILAGGLGTRLRGVVSDVAKPMAPVNGKPFLSYVLDWICDYKLNSLVITAGYKAESIIEHFGNCHRTTSVIYVVEKEPLGTGGAIINALGRLKGNNILVVNGDTWFPLNIDEFALFHLESGAQISVALKRMQEFDRYGTVTMNGNEISAFSEKKYCADGLINGGIYMIRRDFLQSVGLTGKFSFEKDVLEKATGSGILMGKVFNEQFIDIGIPEDYKKAGEIMNFDLL